MSKLLNSKPSEDGFLFPAEFSPHEATWIVWPYRPDNWRNKAVPGQAAYAELANKMADFETVYMAVPKKELEHAQKLLSKKVNIVTMESDDAWVRDTGPTCVKNNATGEIRGVSWIFNAWGGKVDGLYYPWDQDQEVAPNICKYHNIDYYQADLILEGGSIHTDGKGTLYVTEACLLSDGRNKTKGLNKDQIEQRLKDYLGVKKVLWLPHGIYQDETNEHVDNIMQVAEDGCILLSWTKDKKDPQYAYSKASYDYLKHNTNALGEKHKIVKIPAPDPLIYITKEESEGVESVEGTLPRKEGDRQAASYLNHYVGNGAVYVPVFHGNSDDKAHKLIQKHYPSRKLVKIDLAREIILGGGNIHCITQQIPKLPKK